MSSELTDDELKDRHERLLKDPNFLGYYMGEPMFKGDDNHQMLKRASKNGVSVFKQASDDARKALKDIHEIINKK